MKSYNTTEIVHLYESGLSVRELSVQFNGAPKTIKKILLDAGLSIRSRGEQQSLEFKSGKRTKKPNSEITKQKISNTAAANWRKLSKEKREELVENARKRWYDIPEAKRDEMRDKAFDAIRETSKEGSRLEMVVLDALKEAGFHAKHHVKGFLPNEKLEVDILIPEFKTVIEIDGVSHFLPIWGEEALKKTMSADDRKSGLLIKAGYVLLRIKCMNNHVSDYLERRCAEIVLEEMDKIRVEVPKEKYIERELT